MISISRTRIGDVKREERGTYCINVKKNKVFRCEYYSNTISLSLSRVVVVPFFFISLCLHDWFDYLQKVYKTPISSLTVGAINYTHIILLM